MLKHTSTLHATCTCVCLEERHTGAMHAERYTRTKAHAHLLSMRVHVHTGQLGEQVWTGMHAGGLSVMVVCNRTHVSHCLGPEHTHTQTHTHTHAHC